MRTFLQQVAQHYFNSVRQQDLAQYCFVFPNKRSGQFFEYALQQLGADTWKRDHKWTVMLMPRVTTISEFVSELSGTVTANQLECLFCLYDAYRNNVTNPASFDKFTHWASPLIRDFDDIDTCDIDPTDIFKNLDELKSINTDHISDDLKMEIERLFPNIHLRNSDGDTLFVDRNSGNSDDKNVKQTFLSLWNSLAAIYEEYHRRLSHYNPLMVSTGRAYRLAAQSLDKLTDATSLRYKRYVMVGFARLSKCEKRIFKALKELECVDFWWDNASAIFDNDRFPSPAAELLANNVKEFGNSPTALPPVPLDDKDIKLFEIGSTVGQAKYVQTILSSLPPVNDETQRAIILPDEKLLMPLLHSLGDDDKDDKEKHKLYDALNVTIGYQMRYSSIVSLMNLVAKCLTHATVKDNNDATFYRADVRDLVSHPILKTVFPGEVTKLTAQLSTLPNHRVPAPLFSGTPLEPLLNRSMIITGEGSQEQALTYIDNAYSFVNTLRDRLYRSTSNQPAGEDKQGMVPLQSEFCRLYAENLLSIRSLIQCHKGCLSGSTIIYLVNRLAAACVIPFSGEPLKGIQIMGMLETRCLDFDQLIILSANERTLPHRSRINSFIPNWLRNYHNMPTIADQETLSTYYFMRLISRAKTVRIMYDTSSVSVGSNEPSRFIQQLEKIYLKCLLPLTHVTIEQHATEPQAIIVDKDNGKMQELYGANGSQALSASTISKYLRCGLRFYLHKIAGLGDDNAPSDFMDYSELGTIVHNTLEYLYLKHRPNCEDADSQLNNRPSLNNTIKVTLDDLKSMKVEDAVRYIANRDYLHRPAGQERLEPLTGNVAMMQETICSYVRQAIEFDIECIQVAGVDHLEVVECEESHTGVIELDDLQFKFTFHPDRIDRLDGRLRIIDYKTGSDKPTCKPSDNLVTLDNKGDFPHALMQLMLYCYAYTQLVLKDKPEPIVPMLYCVQSKEKGFILTEGKKNSTDARQYVFTLDDADKAFDDFRDQFERTLATKLHNLLNDNVAFTQCDTSDYCKKCNYNCFCHRRF